MNPVRPQPSSNPKVAPPGDDVVQTPGPVNEHPPLDRFCDLVLTGGVASGVVYPWAIVELARQFRFRSIGGTSVGAMAAALAAAAEYGRCTGYEAPFEVLRRAPGSLAEEQEDGRTRMLAMFLTRPQGARLIDWWGRLFRGDIDRDSDRGLLARALILALHVYAKPMWVGGLIGVALAAFALALMSFFFVCTPSQWSFVALSLAALICAAAGAAGAVVGGIRAILSDVREGIVDNNYGLCKGAATAADGNKAQGLTDWLHEGIQRSAGLKATDPPLTFRDLWNAPRYPGAPPMRCTACDPVERRSIDLQMITTNVTHGRPYRLPLADRTSRLFFRPAELAGYFPDAVLKALTAAARPYTPEGPPDRDPEVNEATAQGLLELPFEDMPLVVAARLSLSFPILFSAVPLWAIDYEAPRGERTLRRCLFTDGGVASNFPIHLFDAAVPSWPTFGFWLDRRKPYDYGEGRNDVWLPEYLDQGRGDGWYRTDPDARPVQPNPPPPARNGKPFCSSILAVKNEFGDGPLGRLIGLLTGIVLGAKDWRDNTTMRLPHMRNRIVRIMLRPDEGGLHIGMPRTQILKMAARYGTAAGRKFVERFVGDSGQATAAWREQRWVRFNLLINGLRERLNGLTADAAWSAHTMPLRQAIDAATAPGGPIRHKDPPAAGASGLALGETQRQELRALLDEIERMERSFTGTTSVLDVSPEPELRLRAPL
ncbi:MAG: patatin-like phospholipase family protein [Betaproteobacteria bacterium]